MICMPIRILNYFSAGLVVAAAWMLACPAHAQPRLENLPAAFDQLRDPLTPPGYLAPKQDLEEQMREGLAARITWPTLQLRGITHTGGRMFFAMIDQFGIVEEGEEIRIRQDDMIYTWRVDKISASGISTTRLHVVHVDRPDQPLFLHTPPSNPPGQKQ
jgi:hypothetical protein